jgi:ribonucleotide monophosphatase NagD (HAD superfamily)
MVVALEHTTGVTPLVIGKPGPHLLELAAEAVGRSAGEAIMIGDAIGSDLAAADAVGARTILMLTGVTTRDQVEALSPAERPAMIAADADELAAALTRLDAD